MSGRRITVVASELLGRPGTGGAGTADSLLAVALARHGHDVRLVIASGRDIGELSPEWTARYDAAGVPVHVLERRPGVRPPYLAPALEVFETLRDDPPDVAIVNDWRGLGFIAMRERQLGLALTDTAFIVHCHGPGRVLAEFAQKVPDMASRFGEAVTERACVELADAVVSPSTWLLEWMRAHDWPVPADAQAIPLVQQSVALEETPAEAPGADKVGRLAFFGQLREGKGIRNFLAALESLDPSLLGGVELLFLGSESKRWSRDHVAATLSNGIHERVAAVRIETHLRREEALDELMRPGTLAVMPSLLDNSPNTVLECIEHRVPFVATSVGGIPELVAEEDRPRVLCEPTVQDLVTALTHALSDDGGFAPARPAQEPRKSLDAWLGLVESVQPPEQTERRPPTHVAVVAGDATSAARARRLAKETTSAEVEVVQASSRRAGLARTAADWVVFLDGEDEPDDSLLDTLVAAQAASKADAVTAAVRPGDDPAAIQLFLGDPRALGLLENQYGVVGLMRSELVAAEPLLDGIDPDWPLLARLALTGARIVSVPEPLSVHAGRPGSAGDVPGAGLAVLEAFEEKRGAALTDLPELAATLAAAQSRVNAPAAPPGANVAARGLRVLRNEGPFALVRRVGERVQRTLRGAE